MYPADFDYYRARSLGDAHAARIDEWRRARVAYVSAQASTIRVGHEDIAAWLI